jgi:hypothetical protein
LMEREREAVVWRGEVRISAYSFGWRVACAAACGEGERESPGPGGVGRWEREEGGRIVHVVVVKENSFRCSRDKMNRSSFKNGEA